MHFAVSLTKSWNIILIPAAFALIGIPSRGVELARRLADLIKATEGRKPELGAIDISMHRDDLSLRNTLTSVQETHLPLNLEELTIILVDDVLYHRPHLSSGDGRD